jgi:hypothetical protein
VLDQIRRFSLFQKLVVFIGLPCAALFACVSVYLGFVAVTSESVPVQQATISPAPTTVLPEVQPPTPTSTQVTVLPEAQLPTPTSTQVVAVTVTLTPTPVPSTIMPVPTAPPPPSSPGSSGYTGPYDPSGPDRDCGDFSSRSEAQAFFEAAGGPSSDPHRLDADGDGAVCEDLQ